LVDFGYALVLAGLVFWLARQLGFTQFSAAVAFGLTAVFTNLARLDPEGSSPEKFALAPAVGVFLAGLVALDSGHRRWLVLAGVLGAVAALFKLPDLASFGALSVVLVWHRRVLDGLVWLWVPLVVALAAVWAVFAFMGAGGPFLEATLGYNVFRFGFESQRIPLAGVVAAWQMFRDGVAPLWFVALPGVVVAYRAQR